jgi:hypothetical protein
VVQKEIANRDSAHFAESLFFVVKLWYEGFSIIGLIGAQEAGTVDLTAFMVKQYRLGMMEVIWQNM